MPADYVWHRNSAASPAVPSGGGGSRSHRIGHLPTMWRANSCHIVPVDVARVGGITLG